MAKKADRLKKTVNDEAMLWGEAVAEDYHGVASSHMDEQWRSIIAPFFERHLFDLTRTVDFAAGFGRNTRKLLSSGASEVLAVDVNPDCIQRLESEFRSDNVKVILVSGYDLKPIASEHATFLYTFDAMVHFDIEIVIDYFYEFSRILEVGGKALIHHSNYDARPGEDFRDNPHWRNFMSSDIARHIAARAGFDILEQRIFAWGDATDSDCITVLRKSAR